MFFFLIRIFQNKKNGFAWISNVKIVYELIGHPRVNQTAFTLRTVRPGASKRAQEAPAVTDTLRVHHPSPRGAASGNRICCWGDSLLVARSVFGSICVGRSRIMTAALWSRVNKRATCGATCGHVAMVHC